MFMNSQIVDRPLFIAIKLTVVNLFLRMHIGRYHMLFLSRRALLSQKDAVL